MKTRFRVGDRVRVKADFRDFVRASQQFRGHPENLEGTVDRIEDFDGVDAVHFGGIRVPFTYLDLLPQPPKPVVKPGLARGSHPLIEIGKKYKQRGGRKILRILCTDAPGRKPVVALLENGSSHYAIECRADGRICDSEDTELDLIEDVEPVTRWLVLEPGSGYSSREMAEAIAASSLQHLRSPSVVKVTFTPGEGL